MTSTDIDVPWPQDIDLWRKRWDFEDDLDDHEWERFTDWLHEARADDLEERRDDLGERAPEVNLDAPLPRDTFDHLYDTDEDLLDDILDFLADREEWQRKTELRNHLMGLGGERGVVASPTAGDTSRADLDDLLEWTEELTAAIAAGESNASDATIAQTLGDLRAFAAQLRDDVESLRGRGDLALEHHFNQLELLTRADDRLAEAILTQGWSAYFRDIGSMLADLASLGSFGEDLPTLGKDGWLGEIDGIYETLKDLESFFNTMLGQVDDIEQVLDPSVGSGGDDIEIPVFNDVFGLVPAGDEAIAGDGEPNPMVAIQTLKSDVSDLVSIVGDIREATKEGKSIGSGTRATVGQLAVRTLKSYSEWDAADRERVIARLEQEAEGSQSALATSHRDLGAIRDDQHAAEDLLARVETSERALSAAALQLAPGAVLGSGLLPAPGSTYTSDRERSPDDTGAAPCEACAPERARLADAIEDRRRLEGEPGATAALLAAADDDVVRARQRLARCERLLCAPHDGTDDADDADAGVVDALPVEIAALAVATDCPPCQRIGDEIGATRAARERIRADLDRLAALADELEVVEFRLQVLRRKRLDLETANIEARKPDLEIFGFDVVPDIIDESPERLARIRDREAEIRRISIRIARRETRRAEILAELERIPVLEAQVDELRERAHELHDLLARCEASRCGTDDADSELAAAAAILTDGVVAGTETGAAPAAARTDDGPPESGEAGDAAAATDTTSDGSPPSPFPDEATWARWRDQALPLDERIPRGERDWARYWGWRGPFRGWPRFGPHDVADATIADRYVIERTLREEGIDVDGKSRLGRNNVVGDPDDQSGQRTSVWIDLDEQLVPVDRSDPTRTIAPSASPAVLHVQLITVGRDEYEAQVEIYLRGSGRVVLAKGTRRGGPDYLHDSPYGALRSAINRAQVRQVRMPGERLPAYLPSNDDREIASRDAPITPPPAPPDATPPPRPPADEAPPPASRAKLYAIVGAVVIALGFVAVVLITGGGSDDRAAESTEQVATTQQTDAAAPAPVDDDVTPPPPAPEDEAPPPDAPTDEPEATEQATGQPTDAEPADEEPDVATDHTGETDEGAANGTAFDPDTFVEFAALEPGYVCRQFPTEGATIDVECPRTALATCSIGRMSTGLYGRCSDLDQLATEVGGDLSLIVSNGGFIEVGDHFSDLFQSCSYSMATGETTGFYAAYAGGSDVGAPYEGPCAETEIDDTTFHIPLRPAPFSLDPDQVGYYRAVERALDERPDDVVINGKLQLRVDIAQPDGSRWSATLINRDVDGITLSVTIDLGLEDQLEGTMLELVEGDVATFERVDDIAPDPLESTSG